MWAAVGNLRVQVSSTPRADDSLLRVLHYPPLKGDEPAGAVRAAAHEDINLLTLLPVSAEPGLEVLTKAGEWEAVPGQAGDIVINAAFIDEGWMTGTVHRTGQSGMLPANYVEPVTL